MEKRALMVGVDRYEDGAFWYWVVAAAALAADGGLVVHGSTQDGVGGQGV